MNTAIALAWDTVPTLATRVKHRTYVLTYHLTTYYCSHRFSLTYFRLRLPDGSTSVNFPVRYHSNKKFKVKWAHLLSYNLVSTWAIWTKRAHLLSYKQFFHSNVHTGKCYLLLHTTSYHILYRIFLWIKNIFFSSCVLLNENHHGCNTKI